MTRHDGGKPVHCHGQYLQSMCGATIYRSANIAAVLFRIPWSRVYGHPAFFVTELAVNHTPRMGAAAGLPNCPSATLRVFQSVTNVLVRMPGQLARSLPVSPR